MGFLKDKTLGFFIKTGGIFSQYLFGGKVHIFMLHRVLPENLRTEYHYNRDLAITPDKLEAYIIRLKKEKYQFISLDELYELIRNNRWRKKKYICFTLDDGYRDNITYGLPIFEKHQVPFAIYVTNCFPNGTAHLWWYWLEKKIKENNEVSYDNRVFETKNEIQKLSVYNILSSEIRKFNIEQRNNLLKTFFNKSDTEIRSESYELSLNWGELREIINHPLITIGAHTLNHYALSRLEHNEMEDEIISGKSEMESKLGIKIEHFAYPYGSLKDANNREFDCVKKLGFKTAVLNHPGNIFNSSKNATEKLPRYPLGNNTSRERFEQYLNGIQHFSTNHWNKIPK